MKTLVLDGGFGIERLRVQERPRPEPRAGEALLRMRAATLNYRDLEVVQGTYFVPVTCPLIPVSDGVGEVVAVGPATSRVAVGDRVSATFWGGWIDGDCEHVDFGSTLGGPRDGLLAEYVCVDEQRLVKVPAHLNDQEAASLPCAGVTAWHTLMTVGKLAPGETVLVQGTGGVAMIALQLARLAGARVFVVSGDAQKLERARALGASETIHRLDTPEWQDAVRALSHGRGVDHVLDVAGPSSFSRSLRAVRAGGQVHVIGYLGGLQGTISPLEILMSRAIVRGTSVGSRASFEALNRALDSAQLRPVVDRAFHFTDAVAALNYLQSGRQFGKVALTF